jgi:hypothetical protein
MKFLFGPVVGELVKTAHLLFGPSQVRAVNEVPAARPACRPLSVFRSPASNLRSASRCLNG